MDPGMLIAYQGDDTDELSYDNFNGWVSWIAAKQGWQEQVVTVGGRKSQGAGDHYSTSSRKEIYFIPAARTAKRCPELCGFDEDRRIFLRLTV